jgi:hypothetical protein
VKELDCIGGGGKPGGDASEPLDETTRRRAHSRAFTELRDKYPGGMASGLRTPQSTARGASRSASDYDELSAGVAFSLIYEGIDLLQASCGAEEAGFDVVLAVDSWEDAVEVHKTNHPNAMHLCMELPPQTPLPLPADGENWHIHGSPPCTMVSKANQERDESGRQHAVTLIEWYIEFAMSSSATSWSMEQVATPIVLECIEKYRNKRTPNHKFAYTVLNFNNMGVPQNRKRLIAGSPDVVARLLRIDQWQRCAKDVLVHPRGTHIRNYMNYMRNRVQSQTQKERSNGYTSGTPMTKHVFQ